MTKKDENSDFEGEFHFENKEEEDLVGKYSNPPIILPQPQIETLIYIKRATNNGAKKYEDLDEKLQKAIAEADPLLLKAIKTEFPELKLPINSGSDFEGLSLSQSFVLEKIGKEIEQGKNSFDEVDESLKKDIITNLNWRLFRAMKTKFPNFILPPNLAIQRVANPKEVESATRDALVTKADNGIPTEFVFWDVRTGRVVKHKATINEKNIWVELDGEDFITGPNRNNFEIFQDPETQRYYVLNKKNNVIYDNIMDYIREEGGASHMDEFITLMQPPFVEVKDTLKEFKLYYNEETDKFELPPRNEIYVRNDVIDFLLNRFAFDIKIDEETAREELNRFLKIATPKQLADFLADLGFPIINLINSQIGANVGRIYVCSWGATGTGKTLVHNFAMKYLWGFDYTRGGFSGNSINKSDFRISLILSSTNLPVFIDEATTLDDNIISTIKASTLSGVNFRGTSNQKAKIYPSTATIILTAQNNIFNSRELSNELALERRFYTNYHSIQINSEDAFDTFIADTKTQGYAIYLLQKYTLKELKEIYFNIKKKTKNLILTGILFASKLLNLNFEQFSKIEIEMLGNSPIEKIVYWLYYDYERTTRNETNDIEAKKLSGMMTLKEKDGQKYIAINANYITYVNSTTHPLKNKFHDLGDLNQLEPFFEKDEIVKLPGNKIYAGKAVRFDEKNFISACIPYRYYDDEKKLEATIEAIKIKDRLIDYYKELFSAEQPQQQPQPQDQPQDQEQQQPQQPQQLQPQDQQPQQTQQEPQNNAESEKAQQNGKELDADAEAIKKIKENEKIIDEVIEMFNKSKDGLILGHDFKYAPPEMREALGYLYRNGVIYESRPDVWKKRGE